MGKNPPPGDGHRHGQVTDRSQAYNPHNDRWVKRDTDTGRFIDQKADPFLYHRQFALHRLRIKHGCSRFTGPILSQLSHPTHQIISSWKGKAMMGKWFEDLYTVCNALGICFFTVGSRLAWGPTYLSKLLNACTGRATTPQEIVEMGEKIFTLFKAYNMRQGLTRKEDAWPGRFFEEPLPEGPAQGRVVTREEIHQVLDEYYDLRGWDKRSGLPTEKRLNELGFPDIAAELRALGKLPLDT